MLEELHCSIQVLGAAEGRELQYMQGLEPLGVHSSTRCRTHPYRATRNRAPCDVEIHYAFGTIYNALSQLHKYWYLWFKYE